jgi:L,D-transpeptidase YbiS
MKLQKYLSPVFIVSVIATSFTLLSYGCSNEPKITNAAQPVSSVRTSPVYETQKNIIGHNITKKETIIDNMTDEDVAYLFNEARKRGLPANGYLLFADTLSQTTALISASGIVRKYPMSSSKFGNGSQANSNKTPLGWHKVTERFGSNALPGTRFVARRPTGEVVPENEWQNEIDGDYVLTRILWLSGLEKGKNTGHSSIDTHSRHIYIHGTNQEHLLGKPGSHGCIRLSNSDVIELFDIIENLELYCRII